ncbi:MAG: sensor histidine kinase [Thermodesulfobacteriota bacterium]
MRRNLNLLTAIRMPSQTTTAAGRPAPLEAIEAWYLFLFIVEGFDNRISRWQPQPARGGSVNQSSLDQFLALWTAELDEGVLIIRDETVCFCNPAAKAILSAAGAGLPGRARPDLVTPAPPRPAPGQQIEFVGREMPPKGIGPLVHGLACGLDDGGELWLLRPQHSLRELGALAAGLLHNLAGPLSIIRTSAEIMARHLGPLLAQAPPPGLPYADWPASLRLGLERIQDQVDQLANSARDLLAKLRGEEDRQYDHLDVNEILQRELAFLESEPLFHKMVVKQLDLEPGLPRIWGLYSDFSQSFRNLLRNAVQAMADGPQRVLSVSTRSLADELLVEIGDSGRGIPAQDQARIFEPYFTTRADGGSVSGLGLYSVRQLLMPYQVRYKVESRPGRTVISLGVPLAPAGRPA